jgi:large subunit ribosomal protein L23
MSILKRPLVTEKVSSLNEKGKYGFIVDSDANKVQIRQAVEKVSTLNVMGKKKTRYTKTGILSGRRPGYKKAIVTLAQGEVIDFYSNV